jgi:hypothetical protein
MSVLKDNPSTGVTATAGEVRNFSRPGSVPRPYKTRGDAEAVAAHFRTLRFFTRRGEPYSYRCDSCGIWHVGLDTGARWHSCRDRHDNYLAFIGVHPEADAA